MNHRIVTRLLPALLLVSAAYAEVEPKKDITIRRRVVEGGPGMKPGPDSRPLETEKVAYLGIETMPVDPTVAAQLGLTPNTGLVVRRVADESPASSLLKPHDVLTKIDDQILVNMQQLTVLVRSHKVGDEVKLTLLRAGKETVLKAKLAEQEVPKFAMQEMGGFPFGGGTGAGPGFNFQFRRALPGGPGAEGPDAADVMRLIGGDRMRWFASPRMHIFKRGEGKGSTILDLAAGNFVFSDDQGSVEVVANDGKRELTVKDKEGKVTFQGPINTPEEHEKLPPEVMARLDAIGGAEMGEGDDALEIESRMAPPAPPAKTRRALPAPRPDEPGMRSL